MFMTVDEQSMNGVRPTKIGLSAAKSEIERARLYISEGDQTGDHSAIEPAWPTSTDPETQWSREAQSS
jgi:hypothetical protein